MHGSYKEAEAELYHMEEMNKRVFYYNKNYSELHLTEQMQY